MTPVALVARAVAMLAACAAVACGGGTPLLHPVHPLPRGDVSFGAGVTGQLVGGPAREQIDVARVATSVSGDVQAPDARQQYLEGAVAHTALAPGVSPFVSMRVGLGSSAEGGLAYTGRSVRGDGRYVLALDDFALSAGGGISAVLARPSSNAPSETGAPGSSVGTRAGEIPGLDAGGVSGWALDVPLLAGWRSAADLVQLWLGPRGGYEQLSGDFVLNIDADPSVQQRGAAKLSRWWAGGVLGFAIGVRPIQVALELDVAYQHLGGDIALDEPSGTTTSMSTRATGLSIAPSGALITRF